MSRIMQNNHKFPDVCHRCKEPWNGCICECRVCKKTRWDCTCKEEGMHDVESDDHMSFGSEAEFKEAICRVLTRLSEIANTPAEEGPDDAE